MHAWARAMAHGTHTTAPDLASQASPIMEAHSSKFTVTAKRSKSTGDAAISWAWRVTRPNKRKSWETSSSSKPSVNRETALLHRDFVKKRKTTDCPDRSTLRRRVSYVESSFFFFPRTFFLLRLLLSIYFSLVLSRGLSVLSSESGICTDWRWNSNSLCPFGNSEGGDISTRKRK